MPGHSPSSDEDVLVDHTHDRFIGATLCTISAAGFASHSILGKLAFEAGLNLVTILAGMLRVGPTTASLLSTLEPVFTVILALFS